MPFVVTPLPEFYTGGAVNGAGFAPGGALVAGRIYSLSGGNFSAAGWPDCPAWFRANNPGADGSLTSRGAAEPRVILDALASLRK